MQCHLGPELLRLLCKQQICVDRQAPALLETDVRAHTICQESGGSKLTLHYLGPSIARVIGGCCSPATIFACRPSSSGHEACTEAGNI